jgi:hypothetical protein
MRIFLALRYLYSVTVILACIGATLFLHSIPAQADPWFTGPLLAPAGRTVPAGHSNFEPYVFSTTSPGFYDRNWHYIKAPARYSETTNIIFTHGFTDKVDVQFILPYQYNSFQHTSYHHVGDTVFTLGYQALEQKDSRWKPNLRITLQEVIPTGRFSSLSPVNNGTDASGLGSFQTGVAFNFQHLAQLTEIHYLRTRLSLAYFYAGSTNLHGLTAYGGNEATEGRIDPGNQISADLAAELTLTQHWVGVLEGYFANRQRTTFSGEPGLDEFENPSILGHSEVDQITFAPALEYNFNQHVGVIGGYWWSLAGRDTPNFKTVVVAINVFW